ncbi:MAG TPA: regulatory iron-sulfur-containing complex subunit RicT [Pseudosphingobacterium sp.]|nr:regulatory iron-sulfur-containing complex subunit RicT [Pseudosphingobacterium sp.]
MPSNYIPFNIVEVRFKGSRKDFYINHENLYLEMGEPVAVETATGGYDIGYISLTGELVRLQLKKSRVETSSVEKKIFRKATSNDMDKYQAAKDLEWETMHKARKLALDLGLSMKLSDVDYQGDKTKATFYYTAEGRVDFRELIKRMAETFRIRIEMRQIGMRQEASRLGGIGSCGRELCCSTWLTDFKTVSTAAARYQNLSLNTLKLAGQCGKLKCCLNYELDTYMDALKDIPNDIDRLETKRGMARLQKTDIFKRLMWFSFPGDENWISLEIDKVKEIAEGNKDGIIPEDLIEVKETVEVTVKPVTYDYENVVGQDSLTRLDEKGKKKKRPSRKRNKNKSTVENKASQVEGVEPDKFHTEKKEKGKGEKRNIVKPTVPPSASDEVKPTVEGKSKNNNRRRYRGKRNNTNKDGNATNGDNV